MTSPHEIAGGLLLVALFIIGGALIVAFGGR